MTKTPSLPISRRTMLRGAGAMVALPWLESLDARTVPRPPVRTAVLFMPNGVRDSAWTPKATGREYDLPPILTPLAPVRDVVSVVTGLTNAPTFPGDGHYVKVSGFLTGATIVKTTGRDLNARGVSLDQVLAREIGGATRLPSLELSVEPVTTGIDTNVGYTRLYGSHISWSTPRTPVAREIEPRRVFERMFHLPSPREAAAARSVLDHVGEQARRLQDRLPAGDRDQLAQYLESIREIERRIDRDEAARSEATSSDAELIHHRDEMEARLATFGGSPTERVRLMLDLIVLAFRADITRVATFMFGNAVSNRSFSFLDGVEGGHHEISHHQDKPEQLDQYERISAWHVAELAHVVQQLRDIPEGDGTLLDACSVLFGSGLRDGNRHDPHDLPILLAGAGGGAFSPGQHVAFPRDTPLCRLHLDILAASGVRLSRFGDADRSLLTACD